MGFKRRTHALTRLINPPIYAPPHMLREPPVDPRVDGGDDARGVDVDGLLGLGLRSFDVVGGHCGLLGGRVMSSLGGLVVVVAIDIDVRCPRCVLPSTRRPVLPVIRYIRTARYVLLLYVWRPVDPGPRA